VLLVSCVTNLFMHYPHGCMDSEAQVGEVRKPKVNLNLSIVQISVATNIFTSVSANIF